MRGRAGWRKLSSDERGITIPSTIVGAVGMIIVILGVSATMVFLLMAQINITASTSVTNQMNQPSSALRSDATLAGNIPAVTATEDRLEFIIPGHQSDSLDGAGCRVSEWFVRESPTTPANHELVNIERVYAGSTFSQPSTANPVTPFSIEGASVCTGELVTSRETVQINDTGESAGFTYFNGRGNELVITHDDDEVSVALAESVDLTGMSMAERAAHMSTQIEGVRYTGQVAESDERGLGRQLSIYAAASTLEHKDVEDVAFGSEAVFLEDVTITP